MPFWHQRGKNSSFAVRGVCSAVFDSLWLYPFRLLSPWDSLDKNTGVCCHFLLQGIFPTQGSNPPLLRLRHCRRILYCWAIGEAPQIVLKHLHFLTCISWRIMYISISCINNSETSVQNASYFTFSPTSNLLSPCLWPPQLFHPQIFQVPHLWGSRICGFEISFVCFVNKLFLLQTLVSRPLACFTVGKWTWFSNKFGEPYRR